MLKRMIAVAMSVIMISTGIDMTVFAAEQKVTTQKETVYEDVSHEENVTQEATVKSSAGTPDIAGTNSIGTILADTLSEEQAEQVQDNGNCIMAVEMSGKTAKVSYVTTSPATLVVGIYDNEGKHLLGAGTAMIVSDVRETTLTIDIDTMPKYFYIKSFLVESDTLNPLCTMYENPTYTKEMQEFLAKTTDDFDQDRVYKLDDDKTNNFLVYNENVEQIASQGEVNVLVSGDEENMNYVFENIDSSISTLVVGDVFVYGEEAPLVIKVGSISVDGTTATITGTSAEMEEVFQFVKIDTTCEIAVPEEASEEINAQSYGANEYQTYGWIGGEDGFEITGEGISKYINEDLPGGAELEGSFSATPGACCKIYYFPFIKKYVEVTIKMEVEASLTVSKGWDNEIKIGEVPLTSLAGAVTISVPIYLFVEVEGSVSFSCTMSTELGFSYHSKNGAKWIKPAPVINIECKAEMSVYVGVRIAAQLSVIEVFSGELDFDVGPLFEASYTKDIYSYSQEKPASKHACKNCIDGDISAKIRIGWKLRFCDEEVDGDDLAEVTIPVGDFYYSADNNEFGFGECPYLVYRVEIRVWDGDRKPAEGVTMTATQGIEKFITNAQGMISTYLKKGTVTYKLEKEGYKSSTVAVSVVNAPVLKTVYLNYLPVEEDDTAEDANISVSGGDTGSNSDEDVSGGDFGNVSSGDVSDGDLVFIDVTSGTSSAITRDGSLYMWGDNENGELGIGVDGGSRWTPAKVLDDVVSVKVYYCCFMDKFTSAITKDGNLYMWGYNGYGQVGDGTTYNCLAPTKVLEDVVSVEVSPSSETVGAITKDGSLYMWGYNEYGQVGNGTTATCLSPVKVLEDVVSVEVGYTVGAITKDGSLYMWGRNGGNVGNGTTENCLSPVKVLDDVVSVEIDRNTGAITKDGSLYMWGSNSYGQVGNGTTATCLSPVKVLDGVMSVEFYYDTNAAIVKDGGLYVWGYNYLGQVGNGTIDNCLTPTKVLDDVVSFKSGDTMSAITKDGSLYMWGDNKYGDVGDGTINNCLTPTKVLDDVVVFEPGSSQGAITKDRSLYMWGYNYLGRVGNGTTDDCLTPTKVLDDVVSFKSGDTMSAITEDRSLYRWGNNDYGQVGNGTTDDCLTPTKVLEDVMSAFGEIRIGGAITKDGSIYMWGLNSLGQLGNGTSTNCLVPTKIEFGESNSVSSDNTEAASVVNSFNTAVSAMAQALSSNASTVTNDGNDNTNDGDDKKYNIYTVTFKDKMPGETYNFYVMKTRTGNGDATSGNILYLDQVVADSDGKVKISYIPREEYADAKIFLSGRMGKYDFTEAVVTVNDQLYTGEELFADVAVTYNGELLTEGIDYELCGDYSAIEPGQYNLVVRGTGEYQGEQTLTYHIRRYSLDVFGVIFDSNGGTKVETQEVEKGQPVVEPEAPTHENYHFKGWYLNGELYDFKTPVTDHLTLVAQWDEYGKLTAPKASIPSGSRVNAGREVILSAEEKATIYYTTDGTAPTKDSTVYTQPIVIDKDMTIKTYAVADDYYDSEVAVYSYTVVQNGDNFDTVNPEDVPADGIPTGIWVGKIADQTYTGKAIKPEVRVYDGTRRLVAGRDYTVSYKNNVKAQTDLTDKKAPTVVIKGKGNYTKTLTVAFKILPIDLKSEDVVVDDIVVAYNKKVQKKNPVVYYGNKKLSKKDVKVEFVDTSTTAYQELGTYQVKLTGQGNYDGERIINLIITDKTPLSSVKVAKIKAQPYQNGDVIEPQLEVSYKNTKLTAGTDYDVIFMNNKEIGTATAILTGKDAYVGVKRVTFKIAGTDIKKAKVEGLTNRQYTGDKITQNLVLTYNGVKLNENAYTVKYSNNINVGTATVTITGKGAFSGTLKKTFKITAYDLKADSEKALSEIAQNFEVLYAKGGSKPSVDVIYKGEMLTVGKDYTISYKNNNAVTTAETKKAPTFIIKGKGNFKGTLEGTFRITAKALNDVKAPVSITVNDIAQTGRAGKYISKPVLTDSNGKTLKAGTDYEKAVQYTLKDGTVLDKTSVVKTGDEIVVTVTGKGNYFGTLTATYRVAEADFKKAKGTIDTQVYTGEAIVLDAEDIHLTFGGEPLTCGTDYEVVEGSYKNSIRKGTASVTIKGKGSYGGTKTVKFKIVAKELNK